MTNTGQPAFREIRYDVAGGTATMTLHRPDRLNAFTAAMAVGATMTLPADIRIAADTAKFGFVFARRGLVPEAASSWFLPRIVGISQAMEWVATGRVFDAAEALALPVSRVVPAAELMPAARALADEIAANTSAVSVTLARRMLWSMLGEPTPWDAHRLDSRAISVLGRGPDVAEGVESFLEKRPPRFSARVTDYLDVVPEWPRPRISAEAGSPLRASPSRRDGILGYLVRRARARRPGNTRHLGT